MTFKVLSNVYVAVKYKDSAAIVAVFMASLTQVELFKLAVIKSVLQLNTVTPD